MGSRAFGWTGRRAEWIALACLHGGVFTRARDSDEKPTTCAVLERA